MVAEESGKTTVTGWDVRRHSPNRRWRGEWPNAKIRALSFTPDGGLLIARPGSIDRIETNEEADWTTGPSLPPPNDDGIEQIATSEDGRWLFVATRRQALFVRDQRAPATAWETVAIQGVEAFAVGSDGQQIFAVRSSPLAANIYRRSAGGGWQPPRSSNVTACANVQSVSPAASYVVATWKAQTCAMAWTGGGDKQPEISDVGEKTIADTVFSTDGNAFVAVLSDDDLMVGLGRPTRPRAVNLIRGTGVGGFGANKVNSLGVNNSGTRIVVQAGDEVRIVSLAAFKLLLADLPPNVIVDVADGTHIVHARQTRRGPMMSMTPIESIGQGPSLRREWQVGPLEMPDEIMAGSEAILVFIPAKDRGAPAAWLRSMQSGAVLAGPLDAGARFVGSRDRWVLARSGRGQVELLRSADGRSVRTWGAPEGSSAGVRYVVSPARTAVAIGLPTVPDGRLFDVEVISLRDDAPQVVGRVTGLDPKSWRFHGVDDAGTLLNGTQQDASTVGRRVVRQVQWALAPDRETAGAAGKIVEDRSATTATTTVEVIRRSASGRLAVKSRSLAGQARRSMALVRLDPHEEILAFGTRMLDDVSFSNDERYLVFLDVENSGKNPGVEVVDVGARRTLFVWRDLDAREVKFTRSGDFLKIKLESDHTLLVPLDGTLLDRFANWLVSPRELSDKEKCEYGLAGASCRNLLPASPSRPASAPRNQAVANQR